MTARTAVASTPCRSRIAASTRVHVQARTIRRAPPHAEGDHRSWRLRTFCTATSHCLPRPLDFEGRVTRRLPVPRTFSLTRMEVLGQEAGFRVSSVLTSRSESLPVLADVLIRFASAVPKPAPARANPPTRTPGAEALLGRRCADRPGDAFGRATRVLTLRPLARPPVVAPRMLDLASPSFRPEHGERGGTLHWSSLRARDAPRSPCLTRCSGALCTASCWRASRDSSARPTQEVFDGARTVARCASAAFRDARDHRAQPGGGLAEEPSRPSRSTKSRGRERLRWGRST